MREISTEPIKIGEHVLIDGVEYVTEKYDSNCSECALYHLENCGFVNCDGVIFKRVKKESHGRCIDAYSLAVKVAEAQDKLKGKEYDPFMLLGDVLRWIELEPTVLEASTSTDRFCNTEGCSNSKPDMSKAQNHICPYYQGVCSLDENILCYCEHHYEMCEKFLKVGKERKEMGNRCFINDTVCEYANNNGYCCVSACLKNKSCENTTQEEKEHKGTFDDPLPQPKYEPPKIMLV